MEANEVFRLHASGIGPPAPEQQSTTCLTSSRSLLSSVHSCPATISLADMQMPPTRLTYVGKRSSHIMASIPVIQSRQARGHHDKSCSSHKCTRGSRSISLCAMVYVQRPRDHESNVLGASGRRRRGAQSWCTVVTTLH